MLTWLRRLFAMRRAAAVALDGLPAPIDWDGLVWHGPVAAAPSTIEPIVTDWDVAQAAEQREQAEPGRVDYRFLGVTGEEDA